MLNQDKELDVSSMVHTASRIIEYANDAATESVKGNNDDFLKGKRMAYFEVLSVLQSELLLAGQDLEECGMDFDPMDILAGKEV